MEREKYINGPFLENLVIYLLPRDIINLYLSGMIGEIDDTQWKEILYLKVDSGTIFCLEQNLFEKYIDMKLSMNMAYSEIYKLGKPKINYFAIFCTSFNSDLTELNNVDDMVNINNYNFPFEIKDVAYISDKEHNRIILGTDGRLYCFNILKSYVQNNNHMRYKMIKYDLFLGYDNCIYKINERDELYLKNLEFPVLNTQISNFEVQNIYKISIPTLVFSYNVEFMDNDRYIYLSEFQVIIRSIDKTVIGSGKFFDHLIGTVTNFKIIISHEQYQQLINVFGNQLIIPESVINSLTKPYLNDSNFNPLLIQMFKFFPEKIPNPYYVPIERISINNSTIKTLSGIEIKFEDIHLPIQKKHISHISIKYNKVDNIEFNLSMEKCKQIPFDVRDFVNLNDDEIFILSNQGDLYFFGLYTDNIEKITDQENVIKIISVKGCEDGETIKYIIGYSKEYLYVINFNENKNIRKIIHNGNIINICECIYSSEMEKYYEPIFYCTDINNNTYIAKIVYETKIEFIAYNVLFRVNSSSKSSFDKVKLIVKNSFKNDDNSLYLNHIGDLYVEGINSEYYSMNGKIDFIKSDLPIDKIDRILVDDTHDEAKFLLKNIIYVTYKFYSLHKNNDNINYIKYYCTINKRYFTLKTDIIDFLYCFSF